MVHKPGSTRVLESHVDWLTATFKPGTKSLVTSSMALHWIEARQREGFQRHDWTFQGFLGERTDGISVGSRADGNIVRLSGDQAREHAPAIIHLADNVSRLDVQVTIQDENTDRDWAEQAHAKAGEDARCQAGLTRRQLMRVDPGGTTFYLGSRSSERFFRVYNKTAESEGAYPPGSWRWEVEYKGGRAFRVANHLLSDKRNPERVREVVEQAFGDYGIALPCEPLPKGWRDAGIAHETDDERRLAWLERSVGPMVSRLLETMDPQTILAALNLEAYLDLVLAAKGESEGETCNPAMPTS